MDFSSKDYDILVQQLRVMFEHSLIEEQRMMALMLAAMNGRSNFNLYSASKVKECPVSCEKITREKLLKMLKRENEMRLSKEMLEILEEEACAYETDKHTCGNNEVFVPWSIVKYQKKLVQEFGYKTNEEIDYALEMLRSASALFPNDSEIAISTFYLKYNRSCRGGMNVGDILKDVPLMTCGQEEIKLSEIMNKEKATVIISGSVT